MRIAAVIMLLCFVSVAKIVVAVTTGHFNIGFLIVLTISFTIIAAIVGRSKQTRSGQRALSDLKTLFGNLRNQDASLSGGTNPSEYLLMAAVFGMAAVPLARSVFPRAVASGSSCGSSCGASYGDSSSGGDSGGGGGDGGGSSCGGGGGCGGCGGS
jgi:hypothetical protein